jgi:hypothetical protein
VSSSGVDPGGKAKGSLLIVGTPGVTGTEGGSLVRLGTLVASGTGGSLVLGSSGAGVLTSSSEEEREPWIVARGVPGAMTVRTGSGVGTVSSS